MRLFVTIFKHCVEYKKSVCDMKSCKNCAVAVKVTQKSLRERTSHYCIRKLHFTSRKKIPKSLSRHLPSLRRFFAAFLLYAFELFLPNLFLRKKYLRLIFRGSNKRAKRVFFWYYLFH